MKIRFLIPINLFNEHRINLVKRICPLEVREIKGINRLYSYKNSDTAQFHEGFLENLSESEINVNERIKVVAERLSDFPMFVKQKNEEIITFLIENGEDFDGSPYN